MFGVIALFALIDDLVRYLQRRAARQRLAAPRLRRLSRVQRRARLAAPRTRTRPATGPTQRLD